ncbi:hypothetical protein QWY93_02600 [Echinicola jeungdonensis]|uniref:Uncharacterized protein n=1 Tax=Echinicola jeungdonensis TaxID=709343 RepID=A0ABV5J4H0_9BACT|nr:hypothetical protein [Echinicola jeungdonensis]MDN3668219.1 hypothetical protein [Echinicola jeungdonensis]
MMKYVPRTFFIIIFFYLSNSYAQEKEKTQQFFVNGYLKDMISFNDLGDSTLVDNLIHNRLNFKWYPNENIRFYGSLRSRLFIGETNKNLENFEDFISYDTYYFDLSWTVFNENTVVFNTMIDRLYMEWIKKDLTFKLGRQRINWGINTIWNPNDIFNAYSYFDFDYEERPGIDAVRVEYYRGTNSSIEVAVGLPAKSSSVGNEEVNTFTSAILYKTNKWSYDFQFLGGYSRENWVLGAGWAGNLGGASLKGEVTYFYPKNESETDPKAFVGTLSVDHSIGDFYYNVSYLFNEAGFTDLGPKGLNRLNTRSLTAKNLSPYKHSTFTQASYQIHPLVNGGLGIMIFPGNKALFLSPFVTWNMFQNFDVDFITQAFYAEDRTSGDFQSFSTSYFLRGKWSF